MNIKDQIRIYEIALQGEGLNRLNTVQINLIRKYLKTFYPDYWNKIKRYLIRFSYKDVLKYILENFKLFILDT